jgi:hypothetical protein
VASAAPEAVRPPERTSERTHEAVREEQRREALRLAQAEREEPKREEPRREEPRREEPRLDSKALIESSGLVMIETDRSKAHYTPQIEEPPHLGRPRRERPKAATQEEELQQVETTRK